MFCEHCGSPILDGAKFCPVCGAPVSSEPAAPQSPPQPVLQPGPVQSHDMQVQSSPVVSQAGSFGTHRAGPGPGARHMDTDRSFVKILLLSFVTLGIYGIYALNKISQDVAVMCAGDDDEMPSYLKAFLLSLITFGIYGIWWTYRFGNRLQNNAARYGLSFSENGTTLLLWQLLGSLLCGIGPLVAFYLIVKNVNALSAAYNAQTE